ncbi:MAG: RNA polymerase sigma factor [Chloroflexi bacterium OLB15]|nr:MAG: RNA polymerase sigma factor [Chloroflexi bacterium OLB15]
MRSDYVEIEQIVKRLLPENNADASDRHQAWSEWLLQGGHEPVLRFIRFKNGTRAEDEEILQETLILGYQKVEGGQYEDRNLPFTAFLKKIAWYKIMEASRQGAHEVSIENFIDLPSEDHAHEHDQAEFWKEYESLRGAMNELPARRANIVTMYEHGYSTGEIASMLNIREDLVRKEKSLGLRQLRERIPLAEAC